MLLRLSNIVIAGLVPAIHEHGALLKGLVFMDARNKSGHDRNGWSFLPLKARGAISLLVTLIFGLALLISALQPVHAVQPDEVLPDATLEARARTLSAELRCLVCQNQSIDDSDAPLARDLRILIRDRLKAGDSDDQVIAFLVERYGEFVLLKPRLHASTLLLWFGPFVVLGLGILAVARLRRTSQGSAETALDEEEREKLEAIVKDA